MLQKSNRLRKRHEFQRVQRSGRRAGGQFVVLMAKKARHIGRVGLTVPKNVGKAHDRNLIKRRLRHIVNNHPFIFGFHDVVILALPPILKASFLDLKTEIILLAHRLARGKS